MNRRSALFLLAGVTPFALQAQTQRKVWRIGLLFPHSQQSVAAGLAVFKETLRELGYVEGRDYVLEFRGEDNNRGRLPEMALDLVGWKPDVIVASSATAVRALQRATSAIPIVIHNAGDPVGSGLVKSLANPGGNVTGMSNSLTDIAPKHLDITHEALPHLTRLAVLITPNTQSHRDALANLQESARRRGLQTLPIEAESLLDIERAFASAERLGAQAVIVVAHPIYEGISQQLASLALRHKLAAIGFTARMATDGFLMAYGPHVRAFYKQAAIYTDKILKGARPSDLPVAQPTVFELVINLKTAKALGVKIPQATLVRADRMIE